MPSSWIVASRKGDWISVPFRPRCSSSAAGWRSLVLDARDRIVEVRDGLPAQLGGAAGTLAAALPFNPLALAPRTTSGSK